MYFINFRKKLSFSFLAATVVLLLIVSAALGTISSAAFSNSNQEQNAGISFSSLNPANLFNGNSFGQTVLSSQANQSDENAVFDEFDAWVASFVKSSGKNTPTADDEQIGTTLAIRRREMLKQLIAVNPQAALARAIPAGTFNRLPSFIIKNSEKCISAEGDFLVYAVEANNRLSEDFSKRNKRVREMSASRTERTVVIGETRYKAYVYGRRVTMPTKLDIPLQGIVIDDAMAVDESPSRVIDSPEVTGQNALDADAMQESRVAAEIGGKLVRFSGQAELVNFNKEQIEWESKIGAVRDTQSASEKAPGKESSAQEQTLAPGSPATWTTGTKKVLVILVDFPDRPGFPVGRDGQQLTQARAQNLYANEISPFYVNNSYNKTSLQATVTPLIHLTKNQSYYTQGDKSDELRDDARSAALQQAGYDTNNFDLDSVCLTFTNNLGWVGIGYIGLKGNLLNGAFTAPEMSHELGHNYGLPHANLWRTTDRSIIGEGNHIEYADCFDTMSAFCNPGPQSHFNARYKRLLNCLTDPNVETVTTNGNYTLFAQDSSTPGGIRALKIQKDDNRSYWIEFRQLFTNNSNAMNGAIFHWDYVIQEFPGTDLLDMTPATTTRGDEPLVIGQTFNDYNSGIKITVLGIGNTSSPAESLIINVEFTQFSCTYSLSSSGAEFPMNNTFGSTNVTTVGNNCPWTAISNNSWIVINEGSGNGNGNVSFSLSSNNGGPPRTGTITIAGQTFTVNQAGLKCNGYTNLPSFFSVPASGGDLIYTPNFESPCGTLSPDFDGTSSWIDVSASPVKVLPNNTGVARYGNLKLTAHDTLIGAPFDVNIPVNQLAAPAATCTYPLSPASQNFTIAGGGGVFSIKSPNSAQCSTTYSVTNNNSWITISNPSGQSNDNINYTVAANSGAARTGTITVNNPISGNQTLTVTQAANKSKRIRIVF